MDPQSEQQTELLRLIWNEMKALGTNLGGRIDELGRTLGARIDATNGRLDDTNARLDETNTRLGVVEGTLKVVEDTLKDLAGQQLMLTRYVKHSVDRHDVEIAD